MNDDEIKQILRRYRPGAAGEGDPEVAAALARAREKPELARWLEEQGAAQAAVRAQFRRIKPPAGLREQIISEQAAQARAANPRRNWAQLAGVAAVLAILASIAFLRFPLRAPQDALYIFQHQMVGIALRGYGMELTTNNPAQIRAFLAAHQAPANYALPPAIPESALLGCAVENWNSAKVSLICFRTGRDARPGGPGNFWLFVVDRTGLDGTADMETPQFTKINRLTTATWTKGDKLYFLGAEVEERTLRGLL